MADLEHNSHMCRKAPNVNLDSIVVRFACIGVAIISNAVAFIYLYYKLYYSSKYDQNEATTSKPNSVANFAAISDLEPDLHIKNRLSF